MQYEYSCSLFSHHLLAKTASKQIRPLHISHGAAQCAAAAKNCPIEQNQASSTVYLSLHSVSSCTVVQYRLDEIYMRRHNVALAQTQHQPLPCDPIKTSLTDSKPKPKRLILMIMLCGYFFLQIKNKRKASPELQNNIIFDTFKVKHYLKCLSVPCVASSSVK